MWNEDWEWGKEELLKLSIKELNALYKDKSNE
jgi:hypothetical protein